ncbi:MAG: insulinase family protein, partial [Planctomycetota bacterium]
LNLDKFKKNYFYFVLPSPLIQKPTYKSLLAKVLTRGTKTYRDMNQIQRFLDDHYGASCSLGVSKVGEIQTFSATLSYPNEKFIPHNPKITEELLELVGELLFYPRRENGTFLEAFVETEKQQLKNVMESLYNDKASYAFYQMLKKMCPEEPFRLYSQGSLEELEEITSKGLMEFYNGFYPAWKGHIFIIGQIDEAQWIQMLEQRFPKWKESPHPLPEPLRPYPPKEEKRFVENLEGLHQTHLYLGFRSSIHYGEGDLYALMAANGLYGTFPHSKLFLQVREERGLAYSTYSFLERSKGLLFAYAGISPENQEKVVQLMKDYLREIQEGKITDFELESTLQGMIHSVQSISDSPSQLAQYGLRQVLSKRKETLEEIIEEIRSLTKDRITQAAQTLVLDTVYCLRPA